VPNTSEFTRVSIDFRTVNLQDVLVRREAPNLDSECTGTIIGDFLQATDLQRMADSASGSMRLDKFGE
jgi:hypothetical protein